jgi:putative ABC transport system permease protein
MTAAQPAAGRAIASETAAGRAAVSAAGPARPLAWLGRLMSGEAGPGITWMLALAAALTAFLATAAPRELTAASTRALERTLAGLNPTATGIEVTGPWEPFSAGPSSVITAGQVGALPGQIAKLIQQPLRSPVAQRWGGFPIPVSSVNHPAASAMLQVAPTIEVAYRSALAAHSRLVAGRLPGGPAVAGRQLVLQVAVTPAVAARFSLRVGSVLDLAGGPELAVTGIVAPADPAAPYWTIDPLQAVPETEGGSGTLHWAAGVLAGPAEVTVLQQLSQGEFLQGAWFLPVDTSGITPAQLPALLSAISQVTTANMPVSIHARSAAGGTFSFSQQVDATSTLAASLSGFLAQADSTQAAGSLIVAGLLGSGLVLLLICAWLAAGAYEAELALLRARGGSAGQAARRVLLRAGLAAVPAAAAGSVLAVAAVPADVTRPWLPGLAVAVTAAGSITVLAAWRHRRPRPDRNERGEAEAVAAQWSPRRAVAEGVVILLAAGGLATLRLTAAASHLDAYAIASPVLAAVAASLLAARLYPLPLRALLRAAAARRGPVGFVALAQAARSRAGAVLPVLALVLTMTVAAFAGMVSGSVAAGQAAAAWQQVGADAGVQAPGNNVITAGAVRSLAAVPGVTATTAVYSAGAAGPFGLRVRAPGGAVQRAGIAVVTPGPYAALASRTPWPGVPAALLAPGAAGPGRVPVLASQRLAAALGLRGSGPAQTAVVQLDGISVRVGVEAVIGATPAMPAGGSFLVLPQWAAARLPSIPGPDVLLATGPGTGTARFRAAAAAAVSGDTLVLRQRLLTGLRDAPAAAAAERVDALGLRAAAALIVIALLLGLAVAARGRDRLARRMLALGMPARQARLLALAQALPLLAAGILGMAAAAAGLAFLIGPALNLSAFTGGAGGTGTTPVPVRLEPAALLLPAAGAVLAALVLSAAGSALATRRGGAAAVTRENGG